MLSASVDMLEHLGHQLHADLIRGAMSKTISEDRIHTPGNFYILVYFENSFFIL